MKIVSTHKSHQELLQREGRTEINGLVFVHGVDGRPTAHNATPAQCNLFCGVPGYVFYHDDGSLSGPSDDKKPFGGVAVATSLREATAPGETRAVLEDLLKSGAISRADLAELLGGAQSVPVIGGGAPTATVQAEGVQQTAPATDGQAAPTGEEGGGGNAEQNGQTGEPDYGNVDYLLTLSRNELFGVAKSVGAQILATNSNAELAERIKEAHLAKQTAQ